MKTLLATITMAASAFIATPAVAQNFNFSSCDVVEIVSQGDQQNAHVQLSCVISSPPACAAGNNYVAFDKSTSEGKQWLAMFLMAQATNAKVTGFVHGYCPAFQTNVAQLAHLRLRR
jgi:hypothetical protein